MNEREALETLEKLKLLRRKWNESSIAYNRDCNLRYLGKLATDAKREELRERSEKDFEAYAEGLRKALE